MVGYINSAYHNLINPIHTMQTVHAGLTGAALPVDMDTKLSVLVERRPHIQSVVFGFFGGQTNALRMERM